MNLQIALIALGAILVAGIYFFSRWQETQRRGRGGERQKRKLSDLAEPSLDGSSTSSDGLKVQDFDADQSADVDSASDTMDRRASTNGSVDPVSADLVAADTGLENTAVTASHDEIRHTPDSSAVDSMVNDVPAAEASPLMDEGDGELGDGIPILDGRVDTDSAPWEDPTETVEPPSVMSSEDETRALHVDDGITDDSAGLESGFEPEISDLTVPDDLRIGGTDDDDRDIDMRDQRSSLGAFLSSLKPIDRIKSSFQNRLDAVKADREGTDNRQETGGDLEMHDDNGEETKQADLLEAATAGSDAPDNRPAEDTNSVEPKSGRTVSTSGGAATSGLSPANGFEKLSQIDYYVKLSGERDVSRDSVLAVYREAAAGLSKSHSVYGLRLPDKVWRDLEHEPEESRFDDLVVTVQLADRHGPISAKELTRFSNLVVKLSESTGRGFSFMAPIESAQQQAEAIDRFRRQFDSIFVVNIRPLEGETFEGSTIDRCATQIGLIPDNNRFYARYKPVGKTEGLSL